MPTSLAQFVPAAYMPSFEAPVLCDLYVDSREVVDGSGFVALKGDKADGRDFIGSAFAKGAALAFADLDGFDLPHEWRNKVVHIPEIEARIANMAANFYDNPSSSMAIVAVTGTNGKTSVCRFIADAMNALHGPCGYIGTLGWGIDSYEPLINTTPDVVSVHRILSNMKQSGARVTALEASSIGIDQGRLEDVVIDVAVFTNLSRDHLDYHGDYQTYAEVKRRLFMRPGLQAAVINADDEVGASWLGLIHNECRVITYSMHDKADVRLLNVEYSLKGTSMSIGTPYGDIQVVVQVVGAYNVANLLATCAVLCHYSDDVKRIAEVMSCVQSVAGRMELVAPTKPAVFVDYAHTPDGLDNALRALRPHCQSRLIVVFGCGGDRDVGKRPLMAQVAENLADVLIITSDNPRSEEPATIIEDVLSGLQNTSVAQIYVDRREAIAAAIAQAGPQDCVLIAGKGHEDYQIIGNDILPFDDCRVAAEYLTGGVQ